MTLFLLFNLIDMKLRNFPSASLIHFIGSYRILDVIQKVNKLWIEQLLATFDKVVQLRDFIFENIALHEHHRWNLLMDLLCLEQLAPQGISVQELATESGKLPHDLKILALSLLVLLVNLYLIFLLLIIELLQSFILQNSLAKPFFVLSNNSALALHRSNLLLLGPLLGCLLLGRQFLQLLGPVLVDLRFLGVVEGSRGILDASKCLCWLLQLLLEDRKHIM